VLPALVLCAGYGTRLDPLTRIVAKPAVPLAGRPLVCHIIDWLRQHRVTDIVINLHHRPETLTRELGDGTHLGVRIRYSWEDPILGSGGGVRHALPLVATDRFIVVNGDTLCALDLGALVDEHERRHADVTLAVTANAAPERYNGVRAAADGRITGFVARGPAAAGTWHFVGVQVCESRVFAGLPDGVPFETVSGLYRERLAEGWTALRRFRTDARAVDLGTSADYLAAALERSGRPGASIVEPGASVAASAEIVRSVIWPGASVGERVDLDECIVASGAVVPAGYSGRRVVLVPRNVLRDGEAVDVCDGVAAFPLGPLG
jgi:NDP-sugar pyrophosphorylase family protein